MSIRAMTVFFCCCFFAGWGKSLLHCHPIKDFFLFLYTFLWIKSLTLGRDSSFKLISAVQLFCQRFLHKPRPQDLRTKKKCNVDYPRHFLLKGRAGEKSRSGMRNSTTKVVSSSNKSTVLVNPHSRNHKTSRINFPSHLGLGWVLAKVEIEVATILHYFPFQQNSEVSDCSTYSCISFC